MIKRLPRGIREISERIREHHLFSFAATSAYFLLMSFIPFILIVLVLIRYTSLSETDMMNVIVSVVPTQLEKFVSVIVKEVYTKSAALVPVSVLIALWSAAKGFHALTYGLNVIYRVKVTRNWFYIRFRSMFYTLFLAILLLVSLFLMVFGRGLAEKAAGATMLTRMILNNRYLISCLVLTAIFLLMYRFLPDRKMEFSGQLPGALGAGVAWSVFSWFLSLFYSQSVMNTYGSMTAVILAMIWTYFCMYFFLVGAEVNDILAQAPENNIILMTIRDIAFSLAEDKEKRQIAEEMAVYGGTAENVRRGVPAYISDIVRKIRNRKAAV